MNNTQKIVVAVVSLGFIALIAYALFFDGGEETPVAAECKEGVVTTESGLKYEELTCGTGPPAKTGDQVQVHYTLTLSDGTEADSSRGSDPLPVRLGEGGVIPGFEEGLMGMREGGTRRLTIPPELGYGQSGQGEIPPNETLTFEVELVSIDPA